MKRFFRGRFFTVLVLIVCFLLGFMFSVAVNGHTMPHEHLVSTVVSPLRSGFTWCKNLVSDFFSAFSENESLSEENLALREQLAELQKQLDDLYYDKVQNERYKELLSMIESSYSFDMVSCDVVTVPSDGWNTSFGINCGTAMGIEKGDIVLYAGGLVGKIVEVGLNWATVATFIDPQVSVGAMILSTGAAGVTEGSLDWMVQGKCLVRYLDKGSSVNRGDRVYTSGLGGIYPKGLLLGTISELKYEDNGQSLSAVLTPAVDFSSLREVFVITDFTEVAS